MGKQEISKKVNSIFEQIKRIDENGNEFWSARDFAKVLEYSSYRNFVIVVNKAKEACKNSKVNTLDHFVDINNMVEIGSGAERQIDNIKLSRYACYLIVQNADPSKEVIALGQSYFAVQTRLQEINYFQTIAELGGTMPENLPTSNSIKKLENQTKKLQPKK